MPKGEKKRDVELRRAEIAKLYGQGICDQYEIAQKLRVSQPTVSRDMRVLQERWRQSALIDLDQAKGEKLAEIRAAKRANWDGWRRSCTEFKSRTIKAKGKGMKDQIGKPDSAEQIIETEDRMGDPRFLSNVLDCIERECKLLGLDAPAKNEHSGKDGGPIMINQCRNAIEEQLKSNPELMGKLKDALSD